MAGRSQKMWRNCHTSQIQNSGAEEEVDEVEVEDVVPPRVAPAEIREAFRSLDDVNCCFPGYSCSGMPEWVDQQEEVGGEVC